MAVRVGLISDTHGVADSAVLAHFQGVDAIIHAGDVGHHGGEQAVLDMLGTCGAPVTAVRGNVDDAPGCPLPDHAVVELGGRRVLVTHIVNGKGPVGMAKEAAELVERCGGGGAGGSDRGVDVVVFGHSHKFEERWRGDTLFVNPGSAGPARFSLPRSVAVLTLPPAEGELPEVELIPLGKAPPRPRDDAACLKVRKKRRRG